jgi:RND family efflux transporter MFP subunit
MISSFVLRLRFLLVAMLGASILVVVGGGCNSAKPSVKTSDANTVKTDTPKKKPLRRVIEQPATIEAFEETPLVAHISGYVEKVHVDIGKDVVGPQYDGKSKLIRPGTLLAELAIPEMLKELEQKKAMVALARAEVDQANADLDAAEAHILTAKALVREAESARASAEASENYWKSQYNRFVNLVADNVLDKQNRDESLNKYEAAKARRSEVEAKVQSAEAMTKESEAKRNKAKADVAAAKARVLVAQAEEGRLNALVEYRYIRAPFDGVVTRRNIHTYHFQQPNASGGPSVLFVVAQTDKLRIISEIPEAEAMHIADELDAKIQVPTLKDQTFIGKVTRTSRTLDPKTRTLRIEIDYDNKERKLSPGMYANLIFDVDLKERYTLPASAIFTYADVPCCWRVDANAKAVRTPLKLGVRDGQDVEVLKMQKDGSAWEAVSGKEEIVITNLGAVSEGKEVRVEGR